MLLPVQAAATILCLAVLAMWPPASGPMLLVPLPVVGTGSPAVPAIAAGALLLGDGPVPGSLIVVGDRSRIVAAVASHAVLILAAPAGGCRADREVNA